MSQRREGKGEKGRINHQMCGRTSNDCVDYGPEVHKIHALFRVVGFMRQHPSLFSCQTHAITEACMHDAMLDYQRAASDMPCSRQKYIY